MLSSLIKQFKVRQNDIILMNVSFAVILLVGEIMECILIKDSSVAFIIMGAIFGMYIMLRAIGSFTNFSTIKSLTVGFGEKRTHFLISYYLITVLEYLVIFAFLMLIQLIVNTIFSSQVGTCSDLVLEIGYKFFFVSITLGPLVEIFFGSLYEILGMKAYFFLFAVGAILSACAERISKLLEGFGINNFRIIWITLLVITYLFLIVFNWVFNRKSPVQ